MKPFWAYLRVRLTSADPGKAMVDVVQSGVTVYRAQRDDDSIDSVFYIRRQDKKRLEELARRRGYELRTEGAAGLYWVLRGLSKRPVLVGGILTLLLVTLFLPTRIFFVRVEGNVNVPTRLIIEQCAESGICFGASRREVRSERVKNALLEAMPELQWAGVNTSGCVATVTVQERSDNLEDEKQEGICSIVAARDGVITSVTVSAGNSLCHVGQAVRAGQLLVSGYTDCGISIRAGHADAEIYAQTQRELFAITPAERNEKGETTAAEKKYALLLGKNRINFYKSSGISGVSCDKIYSEYYMTLPGGFTLPVAIIVEEWSYRSVSMTQIPEDETQQLLSSFAQWYLPRQMTAGQVMARVETFSQDGDTASLQGYYACTEMIAQVRSEEILIPYGNDQ